jgi:hypothetical protein
MVKRSNAAAEAYIVGANVYFDRITSTCRHLSRFVTDYCRHSRLKQEHKNLTASQDVKVLCVSKLT